MDAVAVATELPEPELAMVVVIPDLEGVVTITSISWPSLRPRGCVPPGDEGVCTEDCMEGTAVVGVGGTTMGVEAGVGTMGGACSAADGFPAESTSMPSLTQTGSPSHGVFSRGMDPLVSVPPSRCTVDGWTGEFGRVRLCELVEETEL